MEKDFATLAHCPLFREIEPTDLRAMLTCLGAKAADYEKGQVVLAEGSPARCLGIVLEGALQIEKVDYNGNRSILMKLRPGEMVAEAFACAGVAALPVEVVAAEDSRVTLIDARRITHTCNNACRFHNQMIYNLLQGVAMKNILLNQRIEITSKRSTREKLLAYLLMEAKRRDSRRFTIPYDRQELADYLEVERSGLSAEIGKLRREGVIECHRSEFTLL